MLERVNFHEKNCAPIHPCHFLGTVFFHFFKVNGVIIEYRRPTTMPLLTPKEAPVVVMRNQRFGIAYMYLYGVFCTWDYMSGPRDAVFGIWHLG